MIYTNNQGHQIWSNYILSYFERKLDFKLFDKVISAFKVNGKRFEICRTTNNKTYNDFIRCTLLPKNAEICYLDDTFYPEMMNENVYYINIKPYIHDLQFEEIFNRFLESNIGKTLIIQENKESFIDFMEKNIKLYNFQSLKKDKDEYKIDTILSKRILYHLQDFFNKTIKSKNKTSKKFYNNKDKNKTKRRKY